MVAPTAPQAAAESRPEPKGRALKTLTAEPHRAYTAEDLVKLFTPALAKDPEKSQQAAAEMTTTLQQLVQGGEAVDLGSGLFKARLFFDKEERNIEHAFIGGMGNISYRFRSPVFRVNIGVLSLFFIRNAKANDWTVTVRDTTIGRDYGLTRRLRDGEYVFGSADLQETQDNFLRIEGKYIAKKHMTMTLDGENVSLEDHNTLNGTRIDLLTTEGLARYKEQATAFLNASDAKDQKDPIKRGRYVLNKLIQSHQNFEAAFFSAVVDWILLSASTQAAKS
ncbi:MAG: FHA domain-containing protein [Nitrospiraceae bacterium]